jgi:plastocyanin
MEAASIRPRLRARLAVIGLGLATLLAVPSAASAGVDGECPPVAEKPDAVDHVEYDGVQHLTYCYGPITIAPGQNIIKLRDATDPNGQKLWPQLPGTGYITRFDPDLILADGSIPAVDVTHLHHGVWLVQGPGDFFPGDPQFAAGEEKTVVQLPEGFGWPSRSTDTWRLNDMLHDLVARPAEVYVTWKIDFVPATSPDAASIKPVHTRWLDVAGNPSLYPVFDSLRGRGQGGEYTFPDDAPAADKVPCGLFGRAVDSHGCLGAAQTWTANQNATLIQTAGHLHPGGLKTELRAQRGAQTNSLFTSNASYYEPAGAVSWDVSMGATTDSWRVKVQAGDKVSVHATYNSQRADWYEVMGIMPIAVYNGTDVGGVDALDPGASQPGVLTHSHLAENDNHGGEPTGAPNPLSLGSAPDSDGTIPIQSFAYRTDPSAGPNVPTVEPGQSLTFRNDDAIPATNAFHTITSCKEPCTGATGIAYPVADGPVSFDSGELGFNGNMGAIGDAPAADRATWQTPKNLGSGTYTYFCRVHPFMRGAFRVEKQNGPVQTLEAQRKQKVGRAAITATLDKTATLTVQATVKSAKGGKGRKGGKGAKGGKKARSAKALSGVLDASQSTVSLAAKAKTEVKLNWTRSARKKLKAMIKKGGRWKVVVTSTAIDKFGKTSESEVRFKLVG